MTAARVAQRPVVRARRLLSRGPVVRARRRGVRWELDLREGIDFSIWLRGYFEPSTVVAYRRLLRSSAVVLDIGANIGAHTLHLARAVGPGGTVVAFEPTDSAFQRLRANVELNPSLAERITLLQLMLLASAEAPLPGSVVSSWPLLPRRELDSILPGRPQSLSGARPSTVDDAVAALGLRSVELIKLDVDGYECDVLDGSSATLREHRPLILSELAPFVLEAGGRQIEELVDRFCSHGYSLWNLRGDREVSASVLQRLSRQHASMNVLALHRDTDLRRLR